MVPIYVFIVQRCPQKLINHLVMVRRRVGVGEGEEAGKRPLNLVTLSIVAIRGRGDETEF